MSPVAERYVLIGGQVYRWKEKAPFVRSGKSLLGALEYDHKGDSLKCHECGQSFKMLGQHVRQKHPLDVREYKARHGLRMGMSLIGPGLRDRLSKGIRSRLDPKTLRQNMERAQTSLNALRAELTARGEPTRFFAKGMHRGVADERNERGTCQAQSLLKLKTIAVRLGRVPAYDDIPRNLITSIKEHCGGIRKAWEILGFDPLRKIHTKELLVENLQDFYVLNQRLPRACDWKKGRLAAQRTYLLHFGSMAEAYRAAGMALVAENDFHERAGIHERLAALRSRKQPATIPQQKSA
jgi:hypothetical protein